MSGFIRQPTNGRFSADTVYLPDTIGQQFKSQADAAELDSSPTQPVQDPRYNRDSIGFGFSNGQVHINGDLIIGGIRNLISASDDISLISTVNVTKDTSKTVKFRGLTLTRIYGSNFYSSFSTNLGGSGVTLVAGKKYLISCYAMNLSDVEKFVWMRSFAGGGDYGHGAKLISKDVRRYWMLVKATSTTAVDVMVTPSVALGAGEGNGTPVLGALNRSSESFDMRVGAFQIEQVPDDTKQGVAVIGDSTVAGAAGLKDLAASTEWTRWAESVLNVPFFNRGVGGERTDTMDARWATDMTPLAVNASHAIIQGGINDIVQSRTLAQIQASLQSMHDKALADGMQPVMCTCTPTVSIAANAAYEAIRVALNVWLKQTFALVLDLDKVVRDPIRPSQLRRKADWYGDGVHFGTPAKRAIGLYVAAWPFWDFVKPSPYQSRPGNAGAVDAVRPGVLYAAGSGYAVLNVAGEGAITFSRDTRTTAQILELSGALTNLRTAYLPSGVPKIWLIRNTTSGAFPLNVRGMDADGTAIGATITIAQGMIAPVLATGAGLIRTGPDA